MTLAMSVGKRRRYRFHGIHGRHFVQTGAEAGLPKKLVHDAIETIRARTQEVIDTIGDSLPAGFPEEIHASVSKAMLTRLRSLEIAEAE